MSSSKQSSTQGGRPQSGVEGEAEEEEDSESSSLLASSIIQRDLEETEELEDILEKFRNEWKSEMVTKNDKNQTPPPAAVAGKTQDEEEDVLGQEDDILIKARKFFLEGVELERKGLHVDAIGKYKKAVQLVPDIEFRAFEHTKMKAEQRMKENVNRDKMASEKAVELSEEDFVDLEAKFSRLSTFSNKLCRPAEPIGARTHIGHLPLEIFTYILRWVISSDLDLRSLENCSRVCSGFFLASRSPEIWRRVCRNVWGVNSLPPAEPSGGWRSYYLSRPKVKLDGCYIAKMTYAREGERGFQDCEFFRSWHMVNYYRYIRFFPGGRVIMYTSADEPQSIVKQFNVRYMSQVNAGLIGHYSTLADNSVIGVLKKPKSSSENALINNSSNFFQRKGRRKKSVAPVYDIPEQEFHFEFEIKGSKFNQLHWRQYSVTSIYASGAKVSTDYDVSTFYGASKFPPLQFARVKSYFSWAEEPLE